MRSKEKEIWVKFCNYPYASVCAGRTRRIFLCMLQRDCKVHSIIILVVSNSNSLLCVQSSKQESKQKSSSLYMKMWLETENCTCMVVIKLSYVSKAKQSLLLYTGKSDCKLRIQLQSTSVCLETSLSLCLLELCRSLNNNDTSFTTLWFSSRWSWDSKLHQVESIKDWT